MHVNTTLINEREHILQRFVHISRCILIDSAGNEVIQPNVFSQLRKLVDNADELGVHGMASLEIMEITCEGHTIK
jgi:hypothetical protein